MKKVKSFTLSEEAIARLPAENASQFVNDAILAYKKDAPWSEFEYQFQQMSNRFDRVWDAALKSMNPPAEKKEEGTPEEASVASEIPDCCLNQAKCKHWTYQPLDGVWRNKITGEVRESGY